jgi:hypothetical protein
VKASKVGADLGNLRSNRPELVGLLERLRFALGRTLKVRPSP